MGKEVRKKERQRERERERWTEGGIIEIQRMKATSGLRERTEAKLSVSRSYARGGRHRKREREWADMEDMRSSNGPMTAWWMDREGGGG